MPARSEAQRKFIYARFGPEFAQRHHFDNPGKLPAYVHHQQGSANIGAGLYRQKLGGAPKAVAGHPAPLYPPDHVVGMRVPKGGSCCANCKFLGEDGASCENSFFVKWNNDDSRLPYAADEFCSDYYEPAKGVLK